MYVLHMLFEENSMGKNLFRGSFCYWDQEMRGTMTEHEKLKAQAQAQHLGYG